MLPGRAAPHVDVVRDVRHVAEERSLVEDGGDERDVVQVHAAQVRVVDEDAVARREAIGPVGRDGPRHDVGERAQVRRLGEGLGDRAQVAVEERAGEVAAGLDVRGIGGAAERRPHLLGDGEQRVANDLEADGIDVGTQGTRWDGRGRHGRVMVPQTALSWHAHAGPPAWLPAHGWLMTSSSAASGPGEGTARGIA